jgi:hypothetical protein
VSDAAVGAPKKKKDVVSEAAAQVTGVQPQEVKQEIQQKKRLYRQLRMFLVLVLMQRRWLEIQLKA